MRWLSYIGSLEFDDGVDPVSLVAHLADCLRRVGAGSIKAGPVSVSFRGGLFRVRPWHMLVAFDQGELIVDESSHEVRYALSVRELAIGATVMLAFVGASAWSETKHSLIVPLFVIVGWLWLVGGNLLFSLPRFKHFLRTSVDSAPLG